MNITDFNAFVIQRGVLHLPPDLNTLESRVHLAATAGVESRWSARVQVPHGQARGYFQCEQYGAVAGVVDDPVASNLLRKVCVQFDIPVSVASIFEAIAYHDILAYVLARLAYSMDPDPLPMVGDTDAAWLYYLKVWRPGKPDPDRWAEIYPLVLSNIR